MIFKERALFQGWRLFRFLMLLVGCSFEGGTFSMVSAFYRKYGIAIQAIGRN